MAIAKRDMLVALINSLDRSEKRFFTNHYQRPGLEEDDKFYQLFVHLSKGGDPTDETFRRRINVNNPGKMANLQRHLYGQLMESLRRQHRRQDQVIQVQEELDYAHLLYDRGLYLQALLLLKKAKGRARTYHLDLHHILILELEKMIEGQHITRSERGRMSDLVAESDQRRGIQEVTARLTNLQLELQRYFIDHGHVTSHEKEQHFFRRYSHHFEGPAFTKATFRERISHQRARFWYYYCMLKLEDAAGCARAWVEVFTDKQLRRRDLNLYLKGLDHCLTLAFFQRQPDVHRRWRTALSEFARADPPAGLPESAAFQFHFLHLRSRLNQALLEGTEVDLEQLGREVDRLAGVDRHKRQLLRYKVACLMAMNGQFDTALDRLEPILDDRKPLRHDVMIYARMLFICCHHRLENNDLVSYAINNLSRYLGRVDYQSEYPKLILRLLRSLQRGTSKREALANFERQLTKLRNSRYEEREIRYLEPGPILT